jgi:AcrR family transcriptional regulator
MTVAVITYHGDMSRWEPNARDRLIHAAVELYQERGFDQTTVAEIAERAGLTERTFFRHFTDKREVLFSGQDRLEEIYRSTVAAAPATATPMEMVAAAVEAVVPVFEERREHSRRRQAIIAAHPELQERELLKRAAMAATITAALRQRGVPEPAASLAAEAGSIAFKTAFLGWVTDPGQPDMTALIRDAFRQFQTMAAPPAAAVPPTPAASPAAAAAR